MTRATAYWAQGSGSRKRQKDCVTQVTPQPTWETYYNYARQLQESGHQKQAEVYYRQAQLLYDQTEQRGNATGQQVEKIGQQVEKIGQQVEETEHQIKTHNTRNKTTYSYTPPPNRLTPIQPSEASSHAETEPVPPVAASSLTMKELADRAVQPSHSSMTEFTKSIPSGQPLGWRKKSVKFWAVTSLVIGLFVVIGGYIGLFFFYKAQLADNTSGAKSDGSVGWFQESMLLPMVDVLKPALDKTFRISLAAQPLLYELDMRTTPPEKNYVETDHVSEVSETAVASLTKANEADIREAPSSNEGIATAEEDRTDEQAVSAGTVITSDIEMKEDEKTDNRKRSTSRTRTERTRSKKSRRSDHQEQEETTNNNVEPIEPAPSENVPLAEDESLIESTPPPKDDSKTAVPLSEDNSLIENKPPPRRDSKTKELDELLAPKRHASTRSENHSDEKTAIKEKLGRSDVQQGMVRVAPAVRRCGQGRGGTLMMNIVIGPNGRVSSAVAAGLYAGTPIGACASRAVQRARFPESRQSLNVKYPFKL